MKQLGKKLLAALLCGLTCLSLFACNSDTPADTDAAPAESTAAVTDAPEPEAPVDTGWVSAIFGGGPIVTGGIRGLKAVKESGFNTVIIWSVHVHSDGTLYLNDLEVCKDGEFTGKTAWQEGWQSLKQGSTSVTRIELSVGAAGCADFEAIRDMIRQDGVGEDTLLYRNFKALIDATGADAVNYDDESCYDIDSAYKFGQMCESMGVKVTLCPYTNMTFWVNLKNKLGEELVDRIYLQCYDGGNYNNVGEWQRAMKMDIIPGYWDMHNSFNGKTAADVTEALKQNKRYVTGGFMWLYDDIRNLASPNTTADYAQAIMDAQP